jgi:hypothetical protein
VRNLRPLPWLQRRRDGESRAAYEISYFPHAAAASSRCQMLQRQTPTSEGLCGQIAAVCGHKLIEVYQYSADPVIFPPQRLLQRQVASI